MLGRKRFLVWAALAVFAASHSICQSGKTTPPPKRIAAVVGTYYQNSHVDVVVGRLLQTQTLDGRGEKLNLQLVSLDTDQVPANDKRRKLAEQFQFPIFDNVADTTRHDTYAEWTVAWRSTENDRIESTLFWAQEDRPFMHFALLVNGIDRMFQTGQPSWPVERTLRTSGLLDALLISKRDASRRVDTDHLRFSYRTDGNWKEPPAPPTDRPRDGG